MLVKELMTKDVHVVRPNESIYRAAQVMAEYGCGFLPVVDQNPDHNPDQTRVLGTLTDRDLVVRALAKGKPPETSIQDVMTANVLYCYEDDDVEDVAYNMAENQICRQIVLNKKKRLVGIVSLGDIAETEEEECPAEAIRSASKKPSVGDKPD